MIKKETDTPENNSIKEELPVSGDDTTLSEYYVVDEEPVTGGDPEIDEEPVADETLDADEEPVTDKKRRSGKKAECIRCGCNGKKRLLPSLR